MVKVRRRRLSRVSCHGSVMMTGVPTCVRASVIPMWYVHTQLQSLFCEIDPGSGNLFATQILYHHSSISRDRPDRVLVVEAGCDSIGGSAGAYNCDGGRCGRRAACCVLARDLACAFECHRQVQHATLTTILDCQGFSEILPCGA